MKVLSAHHGHHSKDRRGQRRLIIVLGYVALLVFAGSLFAGNTVFTHIPGKPTPKGFANVPGKPSSQTLSRIAFKPDLTVESIRFAKKGNGRIEAAITIKNVGKASSRAARVSALLICGDRSKNKHDWSIKALKAGKTAGLKWLIHTAAGKNTVKVTVNDSHNRANNTLEKTYFVMTETLPRDKGMKAKGVRKALSRKESKHRGVLVVQEVTFDDHRAKKADESWVNIRIKNAGKAETPATSFKVVILRADGQREQKVLNLRSLRPGKAARIEGFFKMSRGINTLKVLEIGRMNQRNIAAFSKASHVFVTRHAFNPQPFKVVQKNETPLAKNTARISAGNTANPSKAPHRAIKIIQHNGSGRLQPTPYGGNLPDLLPDFRVLAIKISPDTPTRKDKIQPCLEIINVGGPYDYTQTNIQATLSINGPLGSEPEMHSVCTTSVKPINNGGNTVKLYFEKIYLPAPGSYTFTAKIYSINPNRESNTSNNKLTQTFFMNPLPDLQVWISHPNDVRISGPKRWFKVVVKNTGGGSSKEAQLVVHIDGDGNHHYKIPPLIPGETFSPHKRGIKWRTKGRKKFYAKISYEEQELRKDNNKMAGALYVYSGVFFNPTAHLVSPAKIYFKKHGKFIAGKKQCLVFRVVNPYTTNLSEKTEFFITLYIPGDGRQLAPQTIHHKAYWIDPLFPGQLAPQTIHHKAYWIDPLFPGEKEPIKIDLSIKNSGRINYSIRCILPEHRKPIHCERNDIAGSFMVYPDIQLGDPVGPSGQLGDPPRNP